MEEWREDQNLVFDFSKTKEKAENEVKTSLLV